MNLIREHRMLEVCQRDTEANWESSHWKDEDILQQNKLSSIVVLGKEQTNRSMEQPRKRPTQIQSSDLRKKCKGYLIEEKDSFQLFKNCFT